jgi:spore coat protein JB
MNDKYTLLNKIKKYDFTLKELNLYLDTHPNCRKALAMFEKYSRIKEAAENEYVSRFGPIVPEQSNDSNHWSWIDDPWPWERS